MFKPDQPCPNLTKLDQIGSNLIQIHQICSDWIRLDQIGSDDLMELLTNHLFSKVAGNSKILATL